MDERLGKQKRKVSTEEARQLSADVRLAILWAPDGNIGEGSYAIVSNHGADWQ